MNQPIRTRRTSNPLIGCSLFLLVCPLVMVSTVVAVAIFSPSLLTGMALQMAGFRPLGDSAEAFVGGQDAVPTIAPLQGAVVAPSVLLQASAFGNQSLENFAVQVEVGITESGQRGAVVTLTEADLTRLCQQYTSACSSEGLALNGFIIRNALFDLRLNGVIARFDVANEIFGLSQSVGVVLRVQPTTRRFEALGLEVNGQLFGTPKDGLGEFIHTLEAQLNQIVDSATLAANGNIYTVNEIEFSDSTLRVSLR